jgi:hypothetical protein
MNDQTFFAGCALIGLLIRGWVGDDDTEKPSPYCEGYRGENADEATVGIAHLCEDAWVIADAMASFSE